MRQSESESVSREASPSIEGDSASGVGVRESREGGAASRVELRLTGVEAQGATTGEQEPASARLVEAIVGMSHLPEVGALRFELSGGAAAEAPRRLAMRLVWETQGRGPLAVDAALALTDLDDVWVMRFDRELASLEPEAFVERLVQGLGMKELVIGHDHGFGRGRSGSAETLRRLGGVMGFTVDEVAPVQVDGHVVSSTAVRRMVGGGDLEGAARLLGRPYVVVGRVERGAGRGRTIGIPTANLGAVPAQKLLPPDGVYAAWVETRTGRFGGMLNQGGKPTFGDGRRSIEVHLFGFAGDLYDEWVKVEWVRRLRDVRKFDSPADLVAQLQHDRAHAESVLSATRQA